MCSERPIFVGVIVQQTLNKSVTLSVLGGLYSGLDRQRSKVTALPPCLH